MTQSENNVKKVDYSFFRMRFFSHISDRIYKATKENFALVDRFKKSYGDKHIEIIPTNDKGDMVKKTKKAAADK